MFGSKGSSSMSSSFKIGESTVSVPLLLRPCRDLGERGDRGASLLVAMLVCRRDRLGRWGGGSLK